MSSSEQGKVVLITGTSTGIGLSTAVQFAQQGFRVVATMRDTSKAGPLQEQAQTAGVSLDVRRLDVQDDASIASCVQEVIQSYGQIDILINNAGAGFLGTMEQTSEQELRRTMEVNFFGVWRVIQAVFPGMRAAGAGRIITVSSVGGLIGQPFNDAYCAAKFAVEGFLEGLEPVAKRLGITISLIEPGPVNSNFHASVVSSQPETTAEVQAAYGPMLDAYMSETREVFASAGQTPAQVGQVILTAATEQQPHFRYPTSTMIQGLIARKYVDTTGDEIVALFGQRLGKQA